MFGAGPASGGVAAASIPTLARVPDLDQPCSSTYPDSRFVVEDGGTDGHGNTVGWCTGYQDWGGRQNLGLPISRPFRVGDVWYQAFESAVLQWNQDSGEVSPVDIMDVLHNAGRDEALARLGVPPRQEPDPGWLVGANPDPRNGLPTSPPVAVGPYVIQRFQRAVIRQWLTTVADAGDAGHTERVPVGDLARSAGLIPAAALVTDPGDDAQHYNWSGVPTVPGSFWSGPDPAVGGWDALYHRVGAFDVGTVDQDEAAMEAEVDNAADLGLTLAVDGYVGRDSAVFQAAADHDVGLVDTYLWGRIDAACGSSLDSQTCHLDDDQLATIEQEVRHHLQITRQDDGVLAYWILDDYPGDVQPALELLHRLVSEENLVDREARPTVCGFGGQLDDRRRAPATTRAAFDKALRNFSPTACDAVALYPYATLSRPTDAANVDWSMGALLPYMLRQLRAHGWNPQRQPLIGIPQTFRPSSLSAPNASAVATQAIAYCGAGASSILFFAWDNSADDSLAELFNAPDLQQGAAQGLSDCDSRWAQAGS